MPDLNDKINLFPGSPTTPSYRDIFSTADFQVLEHQTGYNWIDGKPIFRQVPAFNNFVASQSEVQNFLGSDDFETVTRMYAIIVNAAGDFFQSFQVSTGSGSLILFSSLDLIRMQHAGQTGVSGNCIIEYTRS